MIEVDRPLVSVLMSTFNDADYLEEAIDSILSQTYKNIEFLITDDGSADRTSDILAAYTDPRMHIFSRENRGKATSMNEMMSAAKGRYIVIQDSDDVSCSDRIARLVEEFENYPNLRLVQSGYSLIIDGKVVAPKYHALNETDCAKLISDYKLPEIDPTLMVCSSVAKETFFNPDLKIGQGIDFIYRVAERYPMRVVGEPLYNYRFNLSSVTKTNQDKKIQYVTKVMNLARERRGDAPVSYETILSEQGQGRLSSDNNLSGHFTESAYQLVKSGKRFEAIQVALFSAGYFYRGTRFLKPLAYAFSPVWIGDLGRRLLGQSRN